MTDAPMPPATPVADRARALADRFWEELLEREPTFATAIGDERYDDRLPDVGEAARSLAETRNRAALEELRSIDRGELDVTLRTTLDVLEAIAIQVVEAVELRTDRLYMANHFVGPGVLVGDLASIHRTDTPERLDRYEARLRAFPAYLEGCAEVAREGVATGLVSPRIVVDRAIGQLERIVGTPADEAPVLGAVAEDDAAARERIAAAWAEVVAPAFERYLEVLRDYAPHAAEDLAVTSLPGGEELYAAEIRSWTTLPLDPTEVHRTGVERWEAIHAERVEIASGLGYDGPAAAIAEHRASGKDTPASAEALVERVEDQVARSWDAAPAWFGRLPRANCRVKEVEAYRAADMALAFYLPPSADGERLGTYYINTHDLPDKALHQIAAVTYHEANPGHHFQIALEMEFDDRPPLRRFGGLLAGSSFAEGWGLYSERLADEMGLYVDEWERLGMLAGQAHRAGRLITDTGLHALGWTREQAIAKLEEGGAPHGEAVTEVDRYIALPAQALAYMTGMIEIEEARRRATEREGSAFDLRSFHDRLLSLGQLPLPALRRELA
ncbi:MAG TPA: DUF885 domain-containing protein [Actinomycetota bacterium]|nr:DUF885 domain-containing protein [Actinomycetota bacterium]